MAVNVWIKVIFTLQLLFLCFLNSSGTSSHIPYQISSSKNQIESSLGSGFSLSFASHEKTRYRRQSNTSSSPDAAGADGLVNADTATNFGSGGGQTLPDQSSQPVGGSSTVSIPSSITPVAATSTTTVLPTTPNKEVVKENGLPEDSPFDDADIIHDNHDYYTSSIIPNKSSEYWVELENSPRHETLSNGHRVAAVFGLKFDFYFYGHKVTNVTVATGGFMYMSPFLHQWLTATQYIAPLMANFDPSLSSDSSIYLQSDKSRFIAEWKNVILKDQNSTGKFHFQAILHANGSVHFVYKSVPLQISKISHADHPVKVGLSDAYYNDTYIKGESIKRRVIYEYHKVALDTSSVITGNVIILNPLPTCNRLNDCDSCTKHDGVRFNCQWCNVIGRCSDGLDWYRQHWDRQGCRTANESICLMPATNSSTPPSNSPTSEELPVSLIISPTPLTRTSSVTPESRHTSGNSEAHITAQDAEIAKSNSADCARTNDTTICPSLPLPPKPITDPLYFSSIENACPGGKCGGKTEVPVAVVVIVVLIICGLLAALAGWVYYAYSHPTSRSGMWLIAHRPSQIKSKIKFWKNSSDGSTKYKVESEA